jgi:hypothetical protein
VFFSINLSLFFLAHLEKKNSQEINMDSIDWNESTIPLFPWDNEHTILYRISPTPRYIILRENIKDILASRDREIVVHFRNLYSWLSSGASIADVIADDNLLSLYLRIRIEANRLPERDWKTIVGRGLPLTSIFHDMSYESLLQRVEREISEDATGKKRAEELMNIFMAVQDADVLPHATWSIDHHRLQYILEEDRDLGKIFNEMELPAPWVVAVYHQRYYHWGMRSNLFCRMRRDTRIEAELYESIKNDVGIDDGIYLFYPGLVITLRQGKEKHRLLLEIDNSDLLDEKNPQKSQRE